MSTAVGFQRRDREGGGEARTVSERERKRQRKNGQQFKTKKSPLSPFMTCPVTVPAVALHPILYRFVPGNPCYLCAGRVYSFGEQQWDRIDWINKACQPSVMQSTPGRHICWTLLSGRRPTWGDSASGLLPNGHMKGEFEKCCNRGNPIFRAPVCSLPCLCKKKGRKKKNKEEIWRKVYSASRGSQAKPSQAKPSLGEVPMPRIKLWDQDQGQRPPGWRVYGDGMKLCVFITNTLTRNAIKLSTAGVETLTTHITLLLEAVADLLTVCYWHSTLKCKRTMRDGASVWFPSLTLIINANPLMWYSGSHAWWINYCSPVYHTRVVWPKLRLFNVIIYI